MTVIYGVECQKSRFVFNSKNAISEIMCVSVYVWVCVCVKDQVCETDHRWLLSNLLHSDCVD